MVDPEIPTISSFEHLIDPDVPQALLSGNCVETKKPACIQHQKIMESSHIKTQTTFGLENLTLEFTPGIQQIPGL